MRVTAENIAQASEETGLIPVESVNAIELFKKGGMADLLKEIEVVATDFEPDTSTPSGRKLIASQAYKVSRSKTTIDKARLALVEDLKAETKAIDLVGKEARDFLDALRDKVRQPLTEWEAEQARIEEEKRLAEEAEKARIEAARLAELEERERKIREAEEALERERLERERIEREKQAEAERQAREERIRAEAEEKAKREAEEVLRLERERVEQAERLAKQREEQAERDRIAAAERAEQEKLAAIEAERKKAAKEAEERETRRLAEIERKRQEEEKRAADKKNRDRVNAAAVSALKSEGIKQADAEKVIHLIAAGSVPSVSIRY